MFTVVCAWPWLGLAPLTALRCVMYFRFCGWRHPFIPWDQCSSPGGGTGGRDWTRATAAHWLGWQTCCGGD